jgi:hypothetical protein
MKVLIRFFLILTNVVFFQFHSKALFAQTQTIGANKPIEEQIIEIKKEIIKILVEKHQAHETIRILTPSIIWNPTEDEYLSGLQKLKQALIDTKNPKSFKGINYIYIAKNDESSTDKEINSMYFSTRESSYKYIQLLSNEPDREPAYKRGKIEAKTASELKLAQYMGSHTNLYKGLLKILCEEKGVFTDKDRVREIIQNQTGHEIDSIKLNTPKDEHSFKFLSIFFKTKPPGVIDITTYYYDGIPKKHTLNFMSNYFNLLGPDIASLGFDTDCNFTGGEVFEYSFKNGPLSKRVEIDSTGEPIKTVYADREVFPLDKIYASCPPEQLSRNAKDLYKIAKKKDRVIVAILDTGVDYNHPEIAFKIDRPGFENPLDKKEKSVAALTLEERETISNWLKGISSDSPEKKREFSLQMAECQRMSTIQCHPPTSLCDQKELRLRRPFFPGTEKQACREVERNIKVLADLVSQKSSLEDEKFMTLFFSGFRYDGKIAEVQKQIEQLRAILQKDAIGWDYNNDDPKPYDYGNSMFNFSGSYDHGTHVASIAARGSDEIAILPIRYPKVDNSLFYDAVKFAHSRGARIVNISLGSNKREEWLSLEQAMRDFPDMLFVAAAGNEETDNDIRAHYPSNFELPNLVAVAATKKDGTLADFSNYGKKSVHLAAPGDEIIAATPEQ